MLLFFTILLIIIIYFIVALSKLRLCAICSAVGLTWLGLLIAYFIGWHNDLLLIAVLMGGSVVGLMYKIEKYFKKKSLSNFWLIRILIIVFGFSFVYFLLSLDWDKLIWLASLMVVTGFLSLFFVKNSGSNESQPDSFKHKLDNCCG